MTEPIRHRFIDSTRERLVAEVLSNKFNWEFYPTPRYYFMDYLVNQNQANGYANFIGGLEIKWMRGPADSEVKFPYQKLQQMWLSEPANDRPDSYNRIVIRYTNGLLLAPAKVFKRFDPIFGLTRADTNEHDFNIHFNAKQDLPEYLLPIVINE